jgi:hypothetical protein
MTARRGWTFAVLALALLLFARPACGAMLPDAAPQSWDRALAHAADQLDAAARTARLHPKGSAVIPQVRLPQPSDNGAPPSPSLDRWLRAQLDRIRKDGPGTAQAPKLSQLATSLRRAELAGGVDTSPRLDATSTTKRILAQRSYQMVARPAPAAQESVWQRVMRWLQDRFVELLSRIFGASARLPVVGQIVAALFIALVVLAAVYLVFVLASLIARRQRPDPIDEGTPLPERSEPDALYQLGTIAAGQGRYAAALSFLFQASLASLDRAGVLPYDGSLTAGEYRRAVRRKARAASPHFDEIAQSFVLAAFAERAVSHDEWAAAQAAYRSLRPLLAS